MHLEFNRISLLKNCIETPRQILKGYDIELSDLIDNKFKKIGQERVGLEYEIIRRIKQKHMLLLPPLYYSRYAIFN